MGYPDIAWKEGLELYLEQAIALLFKEVHGQIDWSRGYEFLDKELQQIVREGELGPRTVDKLAKVFLKNGQEHWVLLHLDVQGDPQDFFGRRMYTYNYRIFDRYNRLVATFAILADDRPDWRPESFSYDLLGCTIDFHFPIAKLLDFAGKETELEASDNPFAVVVLAFLKARQTAGDVTQRRNWKLRLIRGLYERGLARKDVQQLFRLIHFFMVLPADVEKEIWQSVQAIEQEKQMNYMTPLEEIWLENGKKQGIAESRASLEAAIELALRLKFGPTGAVSLISDIRSANLSQLSDALSLIEKATSADELRPVLSTPAS